MFPSVFLGFAVRTPVFVFSCESHPPNTCVRGLWTPACGVESGWEGLDQKVNDKECKTKLCSTLFFLLSFKQTARRSDSFAVLRVGVLLLGPVISTWSRRISWEQHLRFNQVHTSLCARQVRVRPLQPPSFWPSVRATVC